MSIMDAVHIPSTRVNRLIYGANTSDSPFRPIQLEPTSVGRSDITKLSVLVNINAGGFAFFGRQRLEAAIKRSGRWENCDLIYCSGAELATQAHLLVRKGAQSVAIFGGDGSARTVAMALRGLDVPILPLPGGTLNRLCHRVHGHANLARILKDIGQAKPVWLSGGRANQHMFLVASGFGPWMTFHTVRETVRAKGIWAGLNALRLMKRDLFSGKLALGGSNQASDVIVAAPDFVDQAFGFGHKDQVFPSKGLEIASARFKSFQQAIALGLAVVTNRWRSDGYARQQTATRTQIEFDGSEIFGLVDGEKFKMGTQVTLSYVARAAYVLSTRASAT